MKKKIAVLRANALGDFIFALPALRALKETFPDDEIVYLGKKMHQDFLTGRPGPAGARRGGGRKLPGKRHHPEHASAQRGLQPLRKAVHMRAYRAAVYGRCDGV